MNSIVPFVSTLFIVTSAVLVAVGWYFIRVGKRETHQKVMIAAAVFAILFLIAYVSRTLIVGNTVFGGPDDVKVYYTIFLLFHIVLATVGAVMGVITIRFAYTNNFAKHRKLGPWTAIVWFITAITGVTVYYLLYIKYPGGDVSNIIDAIFG